MGVREAAACFNTGGIWASGSYIFSWLPISHCGCAPGWLFAWWWLQPGMEIKRGDAVVLVVTAITVALVASLYPLLERGTIQYSINLFLEFGFSIQSGLPELLAGPAFFVYLVPDLSLFFGIF
jgi:hypothetical protein